jgi:hypothetical protein
MVTVRAKKDIRVVSGSDVFWVFTTDTDIPLHLLQAALAAGAEEVKAQPKRAMPRTTEKSASTDVKGE